MPIVLGLVVLTILFGSWAGSRLYRRKNRNPITGAFIGGLISISPPLLPIFLAVTIFRKRLQPGDKGYYGASFVMANTKNKGSVANPTAGAVLSSDKINNITGRLKEIRSLLEQELIDQQEYEKLKGQILGEM